MFICKECLEYYANQPTNFRSVGRCEICKEVKGCSEIKSSELKLKVFVDSKTALSIVEGINNGRIRKKGKSVIKGQRIISKHK